MAADGLAVVTGAAGFIGRHLVRALVARGVRVRALDLHAAPAGAIPEHVEFLVADLRDEGILRRAVEGADTVFHLASAHLQVNAPEQWYTSVNVDAVGNLVSACADARVRRLVHTSSVGIYGHVRRPPADEEAPMHPESAYERTKLAGEQLALREAARLGVDLIVLRPAWVYGPGCPRTEKLLRTIARGRFVFVGAGANQRHPIHVDDTIEAFLLAASAPRSASGRAYLVVGPRSCTVRELVRAGAKAMNVREPALTMPRPIGVALARACELAFGIVGKEPPFSRRSLAFFDNDNAFDGSAAAAGLGFRPVIDLEEGLARVVADQRTNANGTVR